jgi:hypothetical protein
MDIRNIMRRGLAYIVELPEDEQPPRQPPTSSATTKNLTPLTKSPTSLTKSPMPVKTSPNGATSSALPPALKVQDGAGVTASVSGIDHEISTIYQQAGIVMVPFTAEQAREMLAQLPPELPVEIGRQTVRGMLQTMSALGVSPESIVQDAAAKVAALNSAGQSLREAVARSISKSEAEIARLQGEIMERRRSVEAEHQRQRELTQMFRSEAESLSKVQRFFDSASSPV